MRPERLRLKAFGPYANEQLIDFRTLKNHNFMLLCGPVGAGKTALLDAICYALFGVTSGGERQGFQMRSHFADPAQATEVSLDFRVRGELYRVRRQPGLEGAGDEASLTGAEDQLLARGWAAVDEAVAELLGLGPEQFCQASMLPQGQFRRFLEAEPAEREMVLARLFHTTPFEEFQQKLAGQAEAARRALEAHHQKRQAGLEAQGLEPNDEVAVTLLEHRRRLDELEATEQRLRQQEQEAESRERLAEGSQERYLELDQAHAELTRLLEREDSMKERRARLEQTRLLTDLGTLRQAAARRLTESGQAQKALEQAQAALLQAEQQQSQAERGLEEARRLAPEGHQAERRLLELESSHARLEEVQSAERELEAAQNILESLEQALEAGRRTGQKLDLALKRKAQRLGEIDLDAHEREVLALRTREAFRQFQQARSADDLARQLARARKAHRDDRLASLEERVRRLQGELAARQEQQVQSEAARLAEELVAGEPCPVCGSSQHPRPASYSGQQPAMARLAQLTGQLEQAERLLSQTRAEFADKQLLVERLQARLDQATLEVGDFDLRALEKNYLELQRQLDALKEAESEALKLREDLERLRSKGALLEPRQQQVEEQRRQAEQRVVQARAVLDERRRKLEDLGTSQEELERTFRKASGQVDRVRRTQEESQREARAAAEKAAGARAEVQACERALEGALVRQQEAQDELRQRLEKRGLEKGVSFEEPEEGWLEKEESQLRRYDEDLAAARARLERARATAADRQLEDPTAYAELRAANRKQLEATQNEQWRLSDKIEQLEKLQSQADEVGQALEKRAEALGRLARVSTGENPQGTSYQRFVLGRLLEQVLEATEPRLRRLSKGRFQLLRGESSPLELVAMDHFTGRTRPVATLSGGESFLASLALALGLSDVVHAREARVSLESLWVDEGFGFLDSEALDLALGALLELSREGRLVVIVSQLPEMRERVPTRLEVQPGPRGSTVRFV